jgi:hypothetical protein
MKRLFVFFLSIGACCFAVELPFLKFSHAVLSVEKQKVYGQTDPDQYYSFPILSHDPPRITKKAHIDHVKRRAKQHDGDILVIVDDCVGMVAQYFHLTEHLIGIWNFLAHNHPERVKQILFAYENDWENERTLWRGLANDINYHLLTSLFPNASVGLLKDLKSSLKAKTIYVSSRARSHGIPEAGYRNMNGSAQLYYHPHRLRQMRDRVFAKIGITVEPRGESLRITYCKRTTKRVLDPAVEDLLIRRIGQEPHCQIKSIDFATISFREQLQTIANTDLFIGVHGAGLTHLFFLPDTAAVLEYYEGGESAFFRLFSQLRDIHYYGNSHDRWVTESYKSLENQAPFQENVTGIDLEGTIELIKKLSHSFQYKK